jgi:hypothetical protein
VYAFSVDKLDAVWEPISDTVDGLHLPRVAASLTLPTYRGGSTAVVTFWEKVLSEVISQQC